MSRGAALVTVFVVLVLFGATGALAEGYVGASVLQSNASADAASFSFSGDTTGWKAFGGYRFLRFFAVEAAYTDFGKVTDQVSGTEYNVKATAGSVFAVGKFPIGLFEPFVKLGYAYVDSKLSSPGGSSSDTSSNAVYGIGVALNFVGHFQVRAEYEKYDVSPKYGGVQPSSDLYTVSVGAAFRF